MSTATYALSGFTGVLTHWQQPKLVKDESVPDKELEAKVRSGDYFVTLASELDQLGQEASDYGTKVGLENAVSDLIYLQDHYKITKNEQAE